MRLKKTVIRRPANHVLAGSLLPLTRRLRSSVSALGLALSASLTLTSATAAADWTGAASNDWFTTGNWTPNAVPTAGDDVFVDTAPNPAVINNAAATANKVNVGDAASSTGALIILNLGTLTSTSGVLANGTGSIATVTVTGGASWTNSSFLVVGDAGSGWLTVSGGSTVSDSNGFVGLGAGSTGNATVTGAGSTWTNTGSLSIGDSGNGTLDISNGGVVSDSTGYLGYNSGSVGSATVDGAGSA